MDNHLKEFEEIFSRNHGEWRKQWYSSYYQGIKALDDWYGDKGYRQFENWAEVIDKIIIQTLSAYTCDLCGVISQSWKEGQNCIQCGFNKDWDKNK